MTSTGVPGWAVDVGLWLVIIVLLLAAHFYDEDNDA